MDAQRKENQDLLAFIKEREHREGKQPDNRAVLDGWGKRVAAWGGRLQERFWACWKPSIPSEAPDDKFPIEMMPPVIQDLAISAARTHDAQDKIAIAALPLISVISASIGKGLAVQTNKHLTYANTFTYINCRSGRAKSTFYEIAMGPVKKFNEDLRGHWEKEIRPTAQAELKVLTRDIETEVKKSQAGDREESVARIVELEKRKARLEVDLRFWPVMSSDHTPEALMIKGIAQGVVLVATDEASIVETVICGKYSEGFSNEGVGCALLPYELEHSLTLIDRHPLRASIKRVARRARAVAVYPLQSVWTNHTSYAITRLIRHLIRSQTYKPSAPPWPKTHSGDAPTRILDRFWHLRTQMDNKSSLLTASEDWFRELSADSLSSKRN